MMIEGLWALLLSIAVSRRETRPLALVLACKWAANYAAAFAGLWKAPALLDIAFGTAGVLLALRITEGRPRAVLIVCFVVAPLIHAWHWGLWANDVYVGVQYYVVMLGLFTAQACALAWPGVRDLCLRLSRLWPAPSGWSSCSESLGPRRRSVSKSRPMR